MQARIVTLPGDGIGPEVVAEAVHVLRHVAERHGHTFTFEEAMIGGCAIDAVGNPLPADTLAACESADAVLLGAVGGPRWSDPAAPVRPEQGLLKLRQHFDLFANLRPVKAYPALAQHAPLRADLLEGVDILVVRELTSGVYFGERCEQGESDRAWDTMLYTVEQVRRVARVAFEAARKRRGKVASVDKANVLASMRLWRRTVNEVAQEYPDVELEHVLVDACAMYLMRSPARFDVLLAENMFGDILSDEASVLAGSLGMLPSASLNNGTFGVYEPIHGSAPDIAGKGLANPIATILSAALLLRYSLGLAEEARAVEAAVEAALQAGARTADIADPAAPSLSTGAFTDQVLANLEQGLRVTS
ncbi:MAG TPA: 3-isopropylmalate dehydrogenase [Aggregatilineaceae bacterium]|jgi:3-isopropylmalate dehydrogenase|nr:3-isopropylmalate dehydrogenase [Aggregatilineaceae bacterium]